MMLEILLAVYPGADSDEEGSSPDAGKQQSYDVNNIYTNIPSHENLYENVNQVCYLSCHQNLASLTY